MSITNLINKYLRKEKQLEFDSISKQYNKEIKKRNRLTIWPIALLGSLLIATTIGHLVLSDWKAIRKHKKIISDIQKTQFQATYHPKEKLINLESDKFNIKFEANRNWNHCPLSKDLKIIPKNEEEIKLSRDWDSWSVEGFYTTGVKPYEYVFTFNNILSFKDINHKYQYLMTLIEKSTNKIKKGKKIIDKDYFGSDFVLYKNNIEIGKIDKEIMRLSLKRPELRENYKKRHNKWINELYQTIQNAIENNQYTIKNINIRGNKSVELTYDLGKDKYNSKSMIKFISAQGIKILYYDQGIFQDIFIAYPKQEALDFQLENIVDRDAINCSESAGPEYKDLMNKLAKNIN